MSDAALLEALLAAALAATALLGATWIAERLGWLSQPSLSQFAWRCALLAPALVAIVACLPTDLAPRAAFDASPVSTPVSTSSQPDAIAGPVVSAPPSVITSPTRSTASRATAAAQPSVTIDAALARVLLLAWLASTVSWCLLIAARGMATARFARRQRRASSVSAAVQAQADAIARQLGLRRAWLRDGRSLGPFALAGGIVVLPRWVESLPNDQRAALLAHELAHVARRDPLWRLLDQLAAAPLLLHPLTWIALRRLDALAERACDEQAARITGDGRAVARCLAACLERRPPTASPRLAFAITPARGGVAARVRHLLENTDMTSIPDTLGAQRWRRVLLIAVATAVAVALPGVAVSVAAGDSGALSVLRQAVSGLAMGEHTSIRHEDDHIVASFSRDGRRLRVEIDGDVRFSDDESDIAHVANGASVEIAERADGVERSLRVEGTSAGERRTYEVDGKERPFDADARAWLAAVLPTLYRESGYDAPARAQRILERGGADAVMDEAALIRGDFVRALYLSALLEKVALDDAQAQRALALMDGIGSDFERRRVLSAALASQTLGRERQLQFLRAASGIGSDFERAELLGEAAGRIPLEDDARAAWLDAIDGIGSDFERRRALNALIEHGRPAAAAVAVGLEAGADIGSDFEKRELLAAVAPRLPDDAALRDAFFRTAAGIGSDFERREALLAAIAAMPVDATVADHVLTLARGIGSDFETAEVLVALAARMPADAGLVERYRAVARRLGDHERGRAERALDRFAVAL